MLLWTTAFHKFSQAPAAGISGFFFGLPTCQFLSPLYSCLLPLCLSTPSLFLFISINPSNQQQSMLHNVLQHWFDFFHYSIYCCFIYNVEAHIWHRNHSTTVFYLYIFFCKIRNNALITSLAQFIHNVMTKLTIDTDY